MANRQVNLTKRVETPLGSRYCAVVLAANGRVRPDLVLVNGREERHHEGSYYLEWREGKKRRRLSVGKDAQDAEARRQRKEAELNALNNGVPMREGPVAAANWAPAKMLGARDGPGDPECLTIAVLARARLAAIADDAIPGGPYKRPRR
jgi:hypothetical protein